MSDLRKELTFLSYLEDNGEKIDGYFDVREITENWVIYFSKGNVVRIPTHRILKIKKNEVKKDGTKTH